MEATEQHFWFHFKKIYQIDRLLLKKLTRLSSPTEQDLASIQTLSASLATAAGAVQSDISIFSSALVTHLQNLEHTLPNYLTWLSHAVADPTLSPGPDLTTTRDYLICVLAAILDEFPARDDKEAWITMFTDLEILRGWYRRRELEQELRLLRTQTYRRNTRKLPSVPHLGKIVRELASLPKTLSLSCTPELRERLEEYEKSEEERCKAEEAKEQAQDKERNHKEAMVRHPYKHTHCLLFTIVVRGACCV